MLPSLNHRRIFKTTLDSLYKKPFFPCCSPAYYCQSEKSAQDEKELDQLVATANWQLQFVGLPERSGKLYSNYEIALEQNPRPAFSMGFPVAEYYRSPLLDNEISADNQSHASEEAVWLLNTSPVFMVPAFSTTIALHSSVADVLCSAPLGTTNISPAPTETSPSRK